MWVFKALFPVLILIYVFRMCLATCFMCSQLDRLEVAGKTVQFIPLPQLTVSEEDPHGLMSSLTRLEIGIIY